MATNITTVFTYSWLIYFDIRRVHFAIQILDDCPFKYIKRALKINEILRLPTISSASHNVYAYRFAGSDGTVHDGSEDDGEHGAGRTLLSAMNDNGIQNALIVVSRWFGNKIGMRRFTHIVDAGLSAGKNINPS